MTSTERLRTAGFPKRGSAIWGDNGSWGQNTGKGILARTAAGFIPGVGSIMPAGDAIKDFSQGRYWSGLMNTGIAGMGLFGLGGATTAVARGLGLGTKALQLGKRMPILGRMGGSIASKMPGVVGLGERGMNAFGRGAVGLRDTASNMALKFKPLRTLNESRVGQAYHNNSGKVLAGSLLGGVGLSHMQSVADEAEGGYQQTVDGMKSMLSKIHQSPVFSNPMFSDPNNKPPGYDLANRFLN